MKGEYTSGLRDGLAIGVGYFSVSFTFGILAVNGGLSPLVAGLISLTNMTSAGQFAGLTVILAHGSLVELALTQLVINLRYALMSLSLSQRLGPEFTTRRRMLVAFANTDEIFAVAGAVLSPAVRSALGVALYSMFIAIVVPPMRHSKPVQAVVAAAVIVSCVFAWTPLSQAVGSGFAIVISTLAAAALGAWLFPMDVLPEADEEKEAAR